MFFSIDPSSGVPIYEQIVRQVKFAIAEQTLTAGQLLPSVRQLSHDLAINPNTVARAYQQLQADGLLEPLRGRGLAVCAGGIAKCKRFRGSLLESRIAAVLAEALHGGLTADEITDLVANQLRQLQGTVKTVGDHAGTDNASSTPFSQTSKGGKS
jgi:GntR family transcriptional regulator